MRMWRRSGRREEPFVPVLVTGDRAALGLARSLLDSAQIKYWVKNDIIQEFVGGWGRIGAGYNFIVGLPQVLVNKEDAEDARDVLRDIPSYIAPLRPLWLRVGLHERRL